MTVTEKVKQLQILIEQHQLDAYIIPSTDPHMGEYIPAHWAERAWISGFTGSAGTVVITQNFAGLWTDSRYFVQAAEQLAGTPIQLVKLKIPHTPEHIDWLVNTLPDGARIGINGSMIPLGIVRMMQSRFHKKSMELLTETDLITAIWKNRPPLPENSIFEHELRFSGSSREEKIKQTRRMMAQSGASHHLICTLDEVAWLLNLRGTDVSFNPLFVSYVLLSPDENILFVEPTKIGDNLKTALHESGIQIRTYENIRESLEQLSDSSSLLIDAGKTNYALHDAVPDGVRIIDELGPVTKLKAIKNETEVTGLRQVMIKDGVAWVRFLHWLEIHIGKQNISELSAANKLAAFRAEQEHYQGPSFHPISSYGIHGSNVHYAVDEQSDIALEARGIYLCDTGGHYLDGTTDTTRTISLGQTTAEEKKDFTLALKGTLSVSMLRFPAGTKGYQMDILARKALWDHGLNFGHGTGHGVGFFLNVHEGPQTIGTGATGNMQTAIEPGMITTIEPAIYREGSHGMRTENMTLCVADIVTEYGQFYTFETLTLVPIDRNLIELNLLSSEERSWLNAYHQKVYQQLAPHLPDAESEWLKAKTLEI